LATKELGIPVADGVYALCSFKGVEGRMEVIQKNPFYAIVDFAHTPDSLEKALIAVKKLVKNKGKIFAIFGCAGLRDPGKRAKMGKIAYKLADVIVVTAEDPRTEKLRDINDQIIEGMGKKIVVYKDVKPTKEILNKELVKGVKVVVRFDKDDISSRRAAINWAIKSAKAGDVVIAFGKGHEKSLCFGTTEYPWSDIEEMKKALVR
jgi:UDP-N-acetylmuramoyl-L-alanyl-D-glutamate--2,6-diaminopimelate ligase